MDSEEESEGAQRPNWRGAGLLALCLMLSLSSVVFIRGETRRDVRERGLNDDISKLSTVRRRQKSDIRLSKHQKRNLSLTSTESPIKKTVESTLTEVLTFTWDDGLVRYKIDPSYSLQSRKLIQRSITHLMKLVNYNSSKPNCIRFEEIPNNDSLLLPLNYVNFFPGQKCDSTVGRPYNPENHNVSIGSDCMSHGIIQHELLHILGFWHEHSRTDRDKYIRILWDNVLDDAKENFRPYSDPVNDHLGLPYDYGSIMHYRNDAFTRNGNTTIVPIYGSKDIIGQREHPTALDLIKVRLRYQCMKHQNESIYRALLTYPIPLSADENAPDQRRVV